MMDIISTEQGLTIDRELSKKPKKLYAKRKQNRPDRTPDQIKHGKPDVT